jgi:hypothetical protein
MEARRRGYDAVRQGMRRRAVLPLLSFSLGVVIAAAWVGTHFGSWDIERHSQMSDGTLHHYCLWIGESAFIFRVTFIPVANPSGIHRPYWKFERGDVIHDYIEGYGGPLWGRLGFMVLAGTSEWGNTRMFSVPCWLLCLLTFGYSGFWFFSPRRRRRLRAERGLCPMCGYDVRASPDRWPECGSDVKTVAAR